MQNTSQGPLHKIAPLLVNDRIQSELGLVGPQLRNIKESFETLKEKFTGKISELQRKPEAEKRNLRPELMREIIAEAEETLTKIMRPNQLSRFNQLRLQREGVAAFLDDAVRNELSFMDDQIPKLKDAVRKGAERVAAAQSGGSSAQGTTPDEIQEEVMKGIMDLMSEEQVAKWETMQGEKFDFGEMYASDISATTTTGPGSQSPGTRGPGSRGPADDPFSR